MASIKIALISVCLSVLIYGSAEATKCYECTGDPKGDCANAVVSSMKAVECRDISVCHFTDKRSGSERTVSRGCTKLGPVDLCTLLYQLAAQNPIALNIFDCKTCSGDLCNVQVNNNK